MAPTSVRADAVPDVQLGRAWLLLSLALVLHVTDEALSGFLSVYNPTVAAMKERVPWLPVPEFSFSVWLAGLAIACAALLLLSRFAYRGASWIRPAGYAFAGIMILNALGHTAITIAGRSLFSVPSPRPMPGFYSSPLLLGAAIWLLLRLRRMR